MTIFSDLRKEASPSKAKIYARFFKTGKGEYGEGDVFLGLTVPKTREIAGKYIDLDYGNLERLLKSKIHEERLIALLILVERFKKTDDKKEIVDFYLKSLKYVNNWDLVDLSADKILGNYLLDKDKSLLYKLVKSENIWERRIAMISTLHFIRNNKFDDTIRIARILMNDSHDLIHKACGWMLREMGKRDVSVLRNFLDRYHKEMPRTMLRYSIEKFSKQEREKWM